MEVELDTRFKNPWSMIVSAPSSSGKTVFTKQVLNKSDKQFENIFLLYSEWQDGYKGCSGISFVSGMPSSLDAYLELSGPKAMLFDDMIMRADCTNFHSEATPPKPKCHINLQNVYSQGKVMRNVHLNTEYVVLFRNPRDNLAIWQDSCNRNTPKHSWTITWTPPRDRTRIFWWI